MATVKTESFTTRRGIDGKVQIRGEGPPLLHLHGAGGLLPTEPVLDALAERFTVYAPEWPGFGEEPTETAIEDMLDFALHGWDIATALGLERPHLMGHSMGGMIAAEMAALNPAGVDHLVLLCAAGLWIDEAPIPDIFAMLPFQMAEVMFHDPAAGEKMLSAGRDFSDDEALKNFLVMNSRRLGTAGKILFPIPNRRLSKRLYRITNPTLCVWGESDKLIPPVYGETFVEAIEGARLVTVAEAGHMLPYEQPGQTAEAVSNFL